MLDGWKELPCYQRESPFNSIRVRDTYSVRFDVARAALVQ